MPTTRCRTPARWFPSSANPRTFRVPQRLANDLETDPLAEHLDLPACPDRRRRWQVGVRDRALDGEPVAAGRHASHEVTVDANRLVAQTDRARVVATETAQPFRRSRCLCSLERLASDEVGPLAERDGKREPRLERRFVRSDVARPDAVALLEPKGIDRPISSRDHPVRTSRLP